MLLSGSCILFLSTIPSGGKARGYHLQFSTGEDGLNSVKLFAAKSAGLGGYRRKCFSLLSQESSQCCVGFGVGFYPCKGKPCSGFWCCRAGRWRARSEKGTDVFLPLSQVTLTCHEATMQLLHRSACSYSSTNIAKAMLHRFLMHPQRLPDHLIPSGERPRSQGMAQICSRSL